MTTMTDYFINTIETGGFATARLDLYRETGRLTRRRRTRSCWAVAFSAAGQLRVTTGANTIVMGDIDGDGAADFKILLTGAQILTAGSFSL
jgi:hypothetical protein